jgi:Fe2+ transport system protein FeoA
MGNQTARSEAKLTLDHVPVGQSAVVASIVDDGPISRRLMEMGVVPGVKIRVIKSAPFGDPIEVRLMGYNLALRRQEAATVGIALMDLGETAAI